MGQHSFPADSYPVGTLLSSLGWTGAGSPVSEFTVIEYLATGRKYWQQTAGPATNNLGAPTYKRTHGGMYFDASSGDCEILLLTNFTGAELGAVAMGFCASVHDAASIFGPTAVTLVNKDTGVFSGFGYNNAGHTTPATTDGLIGKPAALRITEQTGTNYTVSMWTAEMDGLEAAEAGSSQVVQTGSSSDQSGTLVGIDSNDWTSEVSQFWYSHIGVGTDGEAAPYPQPAQTVITPVPSPVTNIQANQADLSWV